MTPMKIRVSTGMHQYKPNKVNQDLNLDISQKKQHHKYSDSPRLPCC